VDEAAVVAELYISARRAAIPAIPPGIHDDNDVRGWVKAQIDGSFGGPDRTVWVAADAGDPDRIVGMLITEADWVEQLYVDPSHTGRGIGTRLLDHAKALSPGRLQLWTFASNVGAQRFYQRHGFVEVERTDGAENEERAPDIRYTWTRSPFVPGLAPSGS
jgi:GNAT superfamily N-acetyltransferase